MKTTILLSIIGALLAMSCSKQVKSEGANNSESARFLVTNTNSVKKAKGQLLYLPVYSNIPYLDAKHKFDLSGILTIHNTDSKHRIRITQILYYNNDGALVRNYLSGAKFDLKPFQSQTYTVPEKDQSGTGANFVVEWKADTVVSTPIVEVLMIGLANAQGVSFLSSGKVIAEE